MTLRAIAAVVLAAISTFAAVGPAIAGENGAEFRTVAVRTADLNLAKPEGVAVLRTRVGAAVRQVCGRADRMDFAGRNAVAACRAQAERDANAQIAAAIENDRRMAVAIRSF